MTFTEISSQQIFDRFNRESAELARTAIADIPTLDFLSKYLEKNNITRILEFGGGMGTISYFIMLKKPEVHIDIYEDKSKFRDILQTNLSEFYNKYNIIPSYNLLPPNTDYDFAVIDGGNHSSIVENTERIFSRLYNLKAVYVEGSRRYQQSYLCNALRKTYAFRFEKIESIFINGRKHYGGMVYYL